MTCIYIYIRIVGTYVFLLTCLMFNRSMVSFNPFASFTLVSSVSSWKSRHGYYRYSLPVEVGGSSHDLQGSIHPKGVCLEFLSSTACLKSARCQPADTCEIRCSNCQVVTTQRCGSLHWSIFSLYWSLQNPVHFWSSTHNCPTATMIQVVW